MGIGHVYWQFYFILELFGIQVIKTHQRSLSFAQMEAFLLSYYGVETGVPEEKSPVRPGDHKPAHLSMLEIEHGK